MWAENNCGWNWIRFLDESINCNPLDVQPCKNLWWKWFEKSNTVVNVVVIHRIILTQVEQWFGIKVVRVIFQCFMQILMRPIFTFCDFCPNSTRCCSHYRITITAAAQTCASDSLKSKKKCNNNNNSIREKCIVRCFNKCHMTVTTSIPYDDVNILCIYMCECIHLNALEKSNGIYVIF